MRISASFRRPSKRVLNNGGPCAVQARPGSADQGFTLLELLVVLAILGLISAVALPQLTTLGARVEFALNRERLETALATLPYEAFKRHEDLVLGAPSADPAFAPAAPLPVRGEEGGTNYVEEPLLTAPAVLPIPDGWRLEAVKPIYYRSNGFCTGGELIVRVGASTFVYEMQAPRCEPVEK